MVCFRPDAIPVAQPTASKHQRVIVNYQQQQQITMMINLCAIQFFTQLTQTIATDSFDEEPKSVVNQFIESIPQSLNVTLSISVPFY